MKKEPWLAIALLAYAAARAAPPVAGLDEASQAALAVTVAGTILWITEAVPLGVTALLVVVLLAINPGMRLPDALHGFTSEVTFFLVGVAAIGTAVEASGLAQRAARFLAQSARGNPTRLYVQMILSLPALAFLVPSAITRNAILIPAYREALEGMGVGKSGRVGRALMLALGMLNPLASSALPGKALGAFLVGLVVEILSVWGYADVVLWTDQEEAISAVVKELLAAG